MVIEIIIITITTNNIFTKQTTIYIVINIEKKTLFYSLNIYQLQVINIVPRKL